MTMEDNFKAWRAAFAAYHVPIQPEDYYPIEGLKVPDVARHLIKKYHPTSADVQDLIQKKEEHYLKNHRFRFYPGVEKLVQNLCSRAIPLALVTAGFRSRLERTVPAAFLEKFRVFVTGDEAIEGKPSPAPYLKAAERLGVSPADCLVVENAPLGIQSAKAAGTYCIGLCTTVANGHLKGADEIVESFEDLEHCEKIRSLLCN